MLGLFGRRKDGFVRVMQRSGGKGKVDARWLTRNQVLRCCAMAVCSMLVFLRNIAAHTKLGGRADDFALEDYLNLLDIEVRKILREGDARKI